MRRPYLLLNRLLLLTIIFHCASSHAITPEEWRYRQTVDVTTPGLVRADLPNETLDATQPDLADLRLLDGEGNEIPYLLEEPSPLSDNTVEATNLRQNINTNSTVIVFETASSKLISSIDLSTPAPDFTKSVSVEGSQDEVTWETLAANQPVFRTQQGSEKLNINLKPGTWKFLRVLIDDTRSAPIPITTIQFSLSSESAPAKEINATIVSREESAGDTVLTVDLGAANLHITTLQIETPEPLFTRNFMVLERKVSDGEVQNQILGTSTFYRINANGKKENTLKVGIDKIFSSRLLILQIMNEDSPPLDITNIRITRRLNRISFLASQPGRYRLLSGNSICAAPRYDLNALGSKLEDIKTPVLEPGPLQENSNYHPPETLAGLALEGGEIDLTKWKYRKPLKFAETGVVQLHIDLETLLHSRRAQQDLRIVHRNKQVPFLRDYAPSPSIAITATPLAVPKKPTLSRWEIKLPHAGMPLSYISCTSDTTLFKREMRLYEEQTDRFGKKYIHELGRTTWKQTPGKNKRNFQLKPNQSPVSDTLFLETDNGDNARIELDNFKAFYPGIKLLFKTPSNPEEPLWLYYGNPDAQKPSYDLGIVTNKLLNTPKTTAILGSEDPNPLSRNTGKEDKKNISHNKGGIIFWGVLALVVVALLVLLSRLLPVPESHDKKEN